jgi:hypothetical protein
MIVKIKRARQALELYQFSDVDSNSHRLKSEDCNKDSV